MAEPLQWGNSGQFLSPQAQSLLLILGLLPTQRRAAQQAWRWSAVLTAAPVAARTSRKGLYARKVRCASQAVAALRVSASRLLDTFGWPNGKAAVVVDSGRSGVSTEPLTGSLEQDGSCVPISHCECTDSQGHSWAPRSQHQEACNNCSCQAGHLSCTTQSCPPPAHCSWSHWSAWSLCSHSCGPHGQQSRFR